MLDRILTNPAIRYGAGIVAGAMLEIQREGEP